MGVFIFCLVCFGICFALIGGMSLKSLDKQSTIGNKILSISLLIFGCMLAFGGGMLGMSGLLDNGDPLFDLGIKVLLVSILPLLFCIIGWKKRGKEAKVISRLNQTRKLYEECQKQGITECESEKEIQKATLIAKSLNLPTNNIKNLFYEAKSLYQKAELDTQERKLQAEKAEDQRRCTLLEQGKDFYGRDKLKVLLTAERNRERKKAKDLETGARLLYSSSQQKEHDWAVLGGLANGIAGPGAGIATALDVQRKNEEIRARNAVNSRAMGPLLDNDVNGVNAATKRAEMLSEELRRVETKLISNESSQELMKKLSFSDTYVTVTDGESIVVTTKVHAKNVYIFDDVKADIDGCVIAKIYDGSTCVGSAYMVFPLYGVGCTKSSVVDLEGMLLFKGKKGTKYTVEFEAYKLWALEA